MERQSLIKRLIKKFSKNNEEQQTEFMVKDLFAGEIVYFKKQVYSKDYRPNEQGKPITKPAKKFAIFYNSGFHKYTHIKSGQTMYNIEWSPNHDYAIRKIKPLAVRLRYHEIFGNMPEDKVLTSDDVKYIEDRINSMHFYKQKPNLLFK